MELLLVDYEIMEVLVAVASDLGDAIDNVDALQVIPMKGAMTNEIFQINWPTKNGGEVRNVLVRLYGEGVEVFFDKEEEVQTFECMSKHGQGPRFLGRFTCGRVEEFIHARVLPATHASCKSCSTPKVFTIFSTSNINNRLLIANPPFSKQDRKKIYIIHCILKCCAGIPECKTDAISEKKREE
ncbi:hypothetical protein Fmac_002201 [Flemingia macrophylla]|uniref:Uncharacterized protein n=1 Tax=Flemingia macrophylla TaxID=520843 RepID=A0ABD1NJE3_9FABA